MTTLLSKRTNIGYQIVNFPYQFILSDDLRGSLRSKRTQQPHKWTNVCRSFPQDRGQQTRQEMHVGIRYWTGRSILHEHRKDLKDVRNKFYETKRLEMAQSVGLSNLPWMSCWRIPWKIGNKISSNDVTAAGFDLHTILEGKTKRSNVIQGVSFTYLIAKETVSNR